MRTVVVAIALVLFRSSLALTQTVADPELHKVLERMAEYVAHYGQKASAIVAVEKYTQTINLQSRFGDVVDSMCTIVSANTPMYFARLSTLPFAGALGAALARRAGA